MINSNFWLCITIITNFSALASYVFDIQGKTALVTGGAEGIGFYIAHELLSNGARSVSILDIDTHKGHQAAIDLSEEFGYGKVIFIPADISKLEKFEHAFNTSIKFWEALDIVINSAEQFNENNWKLMVDVNAVGTLQGTILGMKYMSRREDGAEGVIINISSIVGIDPQVLAPIYSATQSFILGLGRSFGNQVYYDCNRVRIITVCPGETTTNFPANFVNSVSNTFNPHNQEIAQQALQKVTPQNASFVAKEVIGIIRNGRSGGVWVIEDQLSYEIDPPNRMAMKKVISQN